VGAVAQGDRTGIRGGIATIAELYCNSHDAVLVLRAAPAGIWLPSLSAEKVRSA
jgi:hypothetical protein